MLHPSYSELIDAVNSRVPEGEDPIVTSRYSIIHAAAKRARQIVSGDEPLVESEENRKPLSIAVEELYTGEVQILRDDEPVEEVWETAAAENWLAESEAESVAVAEEDAVSDDDLWDDEPEDGGEADEDDGGEWDEETDDEAWSGEEEEIPDDAWPDDEEGSDPDEQ